MPVVRDARRPVAEAVDGDRQHEEHARPRRRAGAARGSAQPPAEREPERERGGAADERPPRHDPGPAVAQPVLEVAGPPVLQQDPGERARTARATTVRVTSSASPPAKANGERHEPGGAARLRQRDGVGEAREELPARASAPARAPSRRARTRPSAGGGRRAPRAARARARRRRPRRCGRRRPATSR